MNIPTKIAPARAGNLPRPIPRHRLREKSSLIIAASCLLLIVIMLMFDQQTCSKLSDSRQFARSNLKLKILASQSNKQQQQYSRSARSRRNSTAEEMSNNSTQKRVQLSSQSNNQLKRFKTSVESIRLGSVRLSDFQERESSRFSSDSNNNSININNNTIPSSSDLDERPPQRNINSVNGTIDLSQYGQSDVDRLYGDALLVYFKNFNDTLPARRETIVLNGTDGRQVPVYKSESTSSRISSSKWGNSS